jgi:hypothetical protein
MEFSIKINGDIDFNPDNAKAVLKIIKNDKEMKKWQKSLKGNEKIKFDTIVKTANIYQSIDNALHTIHKATLANKNVKNYALVLFGNNVIVAKNCIHRLMLTFFGGRTSKVGEKINQYLESKYYTESRLDLPNRAFKEGATKTLIKNQADRMKSDFNLISKFTEVDPIKKGHLEDLVNKLSDPKIAFIQRPAKEGYKKFPSIRDFPEVGQIIVIEREDKKELAIINDYSGSNIYVTLKSNTNIWVPKYHAWSLSEQQKEDYNTFLADNN